jgi:hypothetical protein
VCPRCFISSRYDPPLQNAGLEEVSVVLMDIKRALIELAIRVSCEEDREDIMDIRLHFGDVQTGRCQVDQDYPADRYLIKYWARAFPVLVKPLDTNGSESFMTELRRFDEKGAKLRDRMVEAVSQYELPHAVRSVMSGKWLSLDVESDEFQKTTISPRKAPDGRSHIYCSGELRPMNHTRSDS